MARRSRQDTIFALLAALAFAAGCGGASDQAPDAPATPTPTPAPPPPVCDLGRVHGGEPVRYRLVTVESPPFEGGSTLSHYDPHTVREFPPPEPLAGTLELAPISPLPEGTRFAASLTRYELRAGSFELSSETYPYPESWGTLAASSAPDYEISFDGSLAGYVVRQNAPRDALGEGCPPVISGLELFGQTTTSSLLLKATLFAVPEPSATEAELAAVAP